MIADLILPSSSINKIVATTARYAVGRGVLAPSRKVDQLGCQLGCAHEVMRLLM